MHTPTLPTPTAVRLACPSGYFELLDAENPPAALRWGCPAAEAHADAVRGQRLRYETLAGSGGEIEIQVRAAGAPAPRGYVCLADPGRWLSLRSGSLALDDGDRRVVVPWEEGPVAVTWYARADLSLYEGALDVPPGPVVPPPGVFPPGAPAPHHVLVLSPLAPDAARPCDDMPRERASYALWHAIQCATDSAEIEDALDAPDPEGWYRLALLHRLAQMGATAAVQRIAARTPADLLAFAARSILAGTSSVAPPPALDDLPCPDPAFPPEEAREA